MDVLKFSVPEIFFGQGSMAYAGLCARQLGGEHLFFVSDPGLERAGWAEKLCDIFKGEGLSWTYYSDIDANPRDFQVMQGAVLYQENNCDVVVALG